MTSLETINAGFLPLLDSAILVAASQKGFDAAEGIKLNLVRETSWANIRDRLVVGHFDVAHLLAPMPIASSLELNPLNTPMIAPMALGLGGNSVTVSLDLWKRLVEAGADDNLDAASVGAALRQVISSGDGPKLRFGVVHPHSGHNYELRYWLSASGIDPDEDVDIVIVPPPLMPDALAAGRVDGFCVGAPWSSVAVDRGHGRIVTVKAAIWRSSPEKVLGLTEGWAQRNPEVLAALIRAIYRAAEWCGMPGNSDEIAAILSGPEYLNLPADILARGLTGNLLLHRDEKQRHFDDFFIPHARAATFPWVSHAQWFYAQMVRWGHVKHTPQNARRAAACYRPDLYRAALAPLGVPVPSANAKVEGALTQSTPVGVIKGELSLGPDGFFDGTIFDPDDLDAYIAAQKITQLPNK